MYEIVLSIASYGSCKNLREKKKEKQNLRWAYGELFIFLEE